ncbi:hypothetical protein B0T17DRAFT_532739 [Bombardia bombarda]|uniref:Secreted protein n=1 Tax=Bombardia bombarda TaxID=252184 RepID=A0AA39X243_9PEZI|nr:hypothetical protein B0T17DRAFT_532739 [Bombardia bombarda]
MMALLLCVLAPRNTTMPSSGGGQTRHVSRLSGQKVAVLQIAECRNCTAPPAQQPPQQTTITAPTAPCETIEEQRKKRNEGEIESHGCAGTITKMTAQGFLSFSFF